MLNEKCQHLLQTNEGPACFDIYVKLGSGFTFARLDTVVAYLVNIRYTLEGVAACLSVD